MDWVAEHHYAMIVHEERLARAIRPGGGLNLRTLRDALSVLRRKLAVGEQSGARKRRIPLAVHPSARSAH